MCIQYMRFYADSVVPSSTMVFHITFEYKILLMFSLEAENQCCINRCWKASNTAVHIYFTFLNLLITQLRHTF